METKEALNRISYMNELIEEGRGRLARAWWVLFIWGLVFCLGSFIGLAAAGRPPVTRTLPYFVFVVGYAFTFVAFIGLPILFSILIARPSTELTKRLLLLNVLLVAVLAAMPLLTVDQLTTEPFGSSSFRLETTFLPLVAVGTLLTATGIFLSRSLAVLGLALGVLGVLTTLPDRAGVLSDAWPEILYLTSGLTLLVYAVWLRSHRGS
jgi:hypothetical protein